MIIGVPKEIKTAENRVALTPDGAKQLVNLKFNVVLQSGAGIGSGFTDLDYSIFGVKIVTTAKEVFDTADLILKVKEPLKQEYSLIRKHQLVFTYFHFASNPELIEAMCKSGATCIAYETITGKDGSLPLLTPMSMIAGRLSILDTFRFMTSHQGGNGVLPGGIPGVLPAKVVVIGGGVVGTEAARVAAGIGADVTILDINAKRLKELSEFLPPNVKTLFANDTTVEKCLLSADLAVGAVLVPGAQAPKVVTEKMVKKMKKGAVLVDVAIDQGGCVETSEKTSFANPVIVKHGVIHYGVTNMPGSVSRTSTIALTQVTLPYILNICKYGLDVFVNRDKGFAEGINIKAGKILKPEILI